MNADANTHWGCGQLSGYRGARLAMLPIAITIVEVPKYIAIRFVPQGVALPCAILCCQVLMACLPFFLARVAPSIASFDRQWLPAVWSQWLWFPGLLLLVFIVYGLHDWLLSFREDWWLISIARQTLVDVAPAIVVLNGVVLILFAPIAEEIFWRAYLLPQLGKLTRWPIALTVHSLLFSFAHIPIHWSLLVTSFFYAMLFGIWRIKYRSILPLVLAHMILNAVAFGPIVFAQYNSAVQSYSKCREIDRLTREPVATAVPALIALMADPDEVVSLHALEVLGKNYRREAEPYFAEALASSDVYTVTRALSAIELNDYFGLKPQVRALVWSSENVGIQISAVLTLRWIGDEEGLSDIAQKHPDERVRHAARDMLQGLQKQKEPG